MGSITRNFANLITADGTSGIPDGTVTNADLAGSISTDKLAGNINFKNIIINGDMSIAQRGTSVSVSDGSNEGYQTCDRYQIYLQNAGSVFTWSQDTDVPTGQGFAKSMKFDVTTADTSVGSAEEVNFRQRIEGQNLQYLKFGTANAEQLTLSFWVKTNKTGIYIVKLYNANSGRDVSASYTVPDSNWNKYTLTFPADTTGSFTNDNGRSLDIIWWLVGGSAVQGGTLNTSWRTNADASSATGQVNFADDTANNFYITGVQLEAGTSASDFEFLPYDVNLQRCQRYCYSESSGDTYHNYLNGFFSSSSLFIGNLNLPTSMRTGPSLTTSGNFEAAGITSYSVSGFTITDSNVNNVNTIQLRATVSGATAGQGAVIRNNNDSTATFILSSEL